MSIIYISILGGSFCRNSLVNPLRSEYLWQYKKVWMQLYFATLICHKWLISSFLECNVPTNQHYDWWPDDTRSQVISIVTILTQSPGKWRIQHQKGLRNSIVLKPVNIHILYSIPNAMLFLRDISIDLTTASVMYEMSLNALSKYHNRFHVNTT